MELYFAEPNEIPLPPQEVRIKELRAAPFPDGRRVAVYLETDPFQKRPNADLSILDMQGKKVASTAIIQPMSRKMELNMHLRGGEAPGTYHLLAVLYYSELPTETTTEENLVNLPKTVVDQAEIEFTIHQNSKSP